MIKVIHTRERNIARAISFGPWKRIYVGCGFDKLPDNQKLAVISHEVGHCEQHHTEIRVLAILLIPFLFFKICRKQELDADKFAFMRGHRESLIEFLSSRPTSGDKFHPSSKIRIEYLKKHEHPSRGSRKSYIVGSA